MKNNTRPSRLLVPYGEKQLPLYGRENLEKDMSQKELFDKKIGMIKAAKKNLDNLRQARLLAILVARKQGDVTIEDIRASWGGEFPSGNWCGSIFKENRFEFTGEYRITYHKGSHCRPVKVWRLK